MKKNRILTLSVAALLGFGTVASLGITASKKKSVVASDTTFADSVIEDKNGQGFAFPNHIRREGEAAHSQVHSALGVRLLDAEDGKHSLQFIAALTGYSDLESAKWTRSATDYDGTVLKESSDVNVTHVYTALADSSTVVWDTALTADTTYYYMVYTMQNIPDTADFATVSVSFTATYTDGTTTTAVSQQASVKGMQGDLDAYGTYAYDSENGTWSFSRGTGYTALTDVVIPEDHYEVEGHVAKNIGKVVAAKSPSNTGAFEGASSMKHLTLPATLQSWETYMFCSNSALESVNFPRDLTGWTGTYDTLPTSSSFQDLYWEAKNLVTFTTKFKINIPTIHIALGVEHLPTTSIFESGYNVSKIVYEGTTAQWNALIAGSEESGLDIDNVICSDTEFVNITFNANGGKFADETESTTVEAVKGKKVATPENPTKSGYIFDGWYTAAEGGEVVDMTLAVSATQTVYAHYTTLVGETFENKISLTTTGEGTFDILSERQNVFATFIAPAADRYYIRIDTNKSSLEGDKGTKKSSDTGYTKIVLLDSKGADMASSDYGTSATTYTNAKPVYNSTDRCVIVDLKQGESINLKFVSSSYENFTNLKGTLAYNIFTSDNDTEDTALDMNLDTDVSVTNASLAKQYIYKEYKFTATETKAKCMSFTYSSSSLYGGFVVKEAGTDGKELKSLGSITSAGLMSLDFEAGKTYIVGVYLTTDLGTDKTLSFKITDEPAGMSKTNPIVDGIEVGKTTTLTRIGTNTTWYKLDLTSAGTYKISISNDSSAGYYTKIVNVYTAAGTEIKKSTFSSWSSTKYMTFDVEEACTVYVEAGIQSQTSVDSKYDLTLELLVAGESRDAAITTDLADLVSDNSLTLNASATGVWYKFTGTDAEFDWATSSTTATIEIYTSSTASSSSYTITNTAAKCKTSGTTSTYYAKVVETDSTKTTATIVKTEHVGLLTNSETLGTYYGKYSGTSGTYTNIYTWKETSDCLCWGNYTTTDVTSTSVKDGIRETHAVSGSCDYFSYSDGTRAIAGYWSGSYGYIGYFSKNISADDKVDSSNSEVAKTSTVTSSSGTMVFKLTEDKDNDNVTYAALVDGKVYLDIDVVFMTEDASSIKTPKDSEFQLKKGDTIIAQYKVSTASTDSKSGTITAEDITGSTTED